MKKNKFYIILLLSIALQIWCCGKKTDIETPEDYQRPKFDNVID